VGQLDPSPAWEVLIPNKRAESLTQRYGLKTSGDDRFVYVYNFTPSTSVTVVDTQTKRRRHGIAIPGCVLNYPVGKRRFASLCGDGSLQVVTLNDQARNRAQPHAVLRPNAEKLVERGQRRRHLLPPPRPAPCAQWISPAIHPRSCRAGRWSPRPRRRPVGRRAAGS
jgi:hypothetical protein